MGAADPPQFGLESLFHSHTHLIKLTHEGSISFTLYWEIDAFPSPESNLMMQYPIANPYKFCNYSSRRCYFIYPTKVFKSHLRWLNPWCHITNIFRQLPAFAASSCTLHDAFVIKYLAQAHSKYLICLCNSYWSCWSLHFTRGVIQLSCKRPFRLFKGYISTSHAIFSVNWMHVSKYIFLSIYPKDPLLPTTPHFH